LHRPDLVTACLQSLSRQTFPQAEFEVIVVENQAREQEPAPATPPGLAIRRILLKQNWGTTASINHALTLSDSTYVLLLNNDVELEANFLQVLVTALEADSTLGFATPKLLKAGDRRQLDGAGDALLLGGGAYRLGHSDDSTKFDVAGGVLAGCGAATMYRRAMVAQTGGLDEDFFAYLEDIDLALRAHLQGWRGAYLPSAIAYHIGSATLGDAVHPNIIQFLTRNQLLLLSKNYPASLLVRLLPRILLFQLLWFALSVKRSATGAYLKGLLGAARLLPRMLRKRRTEMHQRKLASREFLELLRNSENQIRAWHMTRDLRQRSRLLDIYFRVFKSSV
jgi:GT2 family glycosyltransferase